MDSKTNLTYMYKQVSARERHMEKATTRLISWTLISTHMRMAGPKVLFRERAKSAYFRSASSNQGT